MDGKPFKFAGANFYPAMITAAGNPPNDSTRPAAQKLLDAMPPLGLTVMRCWAFNDGPAWQSLQPSPGNYSEHVLRCFSLNSRMLGYSMQARQGPGAQWLDAQRGLQ